MSSRPRDLATERNPFICTFCWKEFPAEGHLKMHVSYRCKKATEAVHQMKADQKAFQEKSKKYLFNDMKSES